MFVKGKGIAAILGLLFIGFVNISSASNLSSLLGEYSQLGDLSQKTKKEAAGNLIVFTRADLDRMKIKTLAELINYLPFMRYYEDETNLSSIGYAPYQYGTFNPLIIYINDREITSPFFGNGFQIVSKIDLDFIDHIEVYLGIPSYDIGIHSSHCVIKLYTKKGYRENSTVLGSYYGTYNTNSEYISAGKGSENLSYFIYFNRKFLYRKRLHHRVDDRVYDLSRDLNYYNFYGELDTRNFRVSGEALWTDLDNFIGRSWDITTKKANSKFRYLSGSIDYFSDDKSWKISLSYSNYLTRGEQKSDGPMGIIQVPPIYLTYNNFYLKLGGKLVDVNVEKNLKFGKNELLVGIFGRYKGFNFKSYKTYIEGLGTLDFKLPSYNREYVYDLYFENKYLINPKNIFMLSLKSEKHLLNGGIRNYTLFGAKTGYIFNNDKITFKTFLEYKTNPISSYVLFRQAYLGGRRVSPSQSSGGSIELDYRKANSKYSFLFIENFNKNFIYFDGRSYNNHNYSIIFTGLSLKYRYNFDPFNKIELSGWYLRANHMPYLSKKLTGLLGDNIKTKNFNYFGAYISLFNKIGNFSLFNSLSYRGIFNDNRPSFNLCSTIIYNPTDRLTIYLKGINLLNRGVTTTYIAINPLTGKVSTLNHVQPIDRTVWLGVEYTF